MKGRKKPVRYGLHEATEEPVTSTLRTGKARLCVVHTERSQKEVRKKAVLS